MAGVSADAVTLDLLREARETVMSSPLGVIKTPMIPWCQTSLPLNINCNIHIKLENMQTTGGNPVHSSGVTGSHRNIFYGSAWP